MAIKATLIKPMPMYWVMYKLQNKYHTEWARVWGYCNIFFLKTRICISHQHCDLELGFPIHMCLASWRKSCNAHWSDFWSIKTIHAVGLECPMPHPLMYTISIAIYYRLRRGVSRHSVNPHLQMLAVSLRKKWLQVACIPCPNWQQNAVLQECDCHFWWSHWC